MAVDSDDRRVVFYSTNDMSSWWNLERSQEILTNIDENKDYSINDFLEFYNIKKYFDNGIFLKKWNDIEKEKYIKVSEKMWKKTILFFKSISDEKIINFIDNLEYNYEESFYELINKLKVYEKISNVILNELLDKKPYQINYILKYKKIVKYYDDSLKDFLLKYDKSWNILLDIVISDIKNEKLYLPDSITNEDKENIIIKYIEDDNEAFANLKVIQTLWDWFLKLSSRTKLKAKKMYEKKNQDFFKNNNNTIKYWYNVGISENQKELIKIEKTKNWLPSISYSLNCFDIFYNKTNSLLIFRLIFRYINDLGLIKLISKESEIGIMERVFSHWNKTDYKISATFRNNEMLSLLNLQIFQTYLIKSQKFSLELLINNYIKKKLSKVKWLENLKLQLDTLDIDYQKKIKLIIPEFDYFIKQYRCFVNEWTIDNELIDLDSKPISYESIPSLLSNKYYYELDNKLNNLKHYFYSDQSWLFYINWFENKYKDFYSLINTEELKLDNFHNYQQEIIKFLIKEDYLYSDKEKNIRIKDENFIFIVWEIFREWVIAYDWYNDSIKNKINELNTNKILFSESTLLSIQEADYFNYYLNKSKFSNWPEIRNKNIHWYTYTSKDEAYTDYLILLKIIILILLKIEFELNFDLLTKKYANI